MRRTATIVSIAILPLLAVDFGAARPACPAALRVERFAAQRPVRLGGVARPVVEVLPLERWVELAVAAEAEPGTPPAALAALAIVIRSYGSATPDRHRSAAVCDLAHCVVLEDGARLDAQRDAARVAAREAASSTRGVVLVDASGRVLRTPFHRCCGGSTADPGATFGTPDETGAAVVVDRGCDAERWAVQIALPRLLETVRTALALGRAPRWDDLLLTHDAAGRVMRLQDRTSGRFVVGDALARALDLAHGWGQVRSARFTWQRHGGDVTVQGWGAGHGVGLCQRGATAAARAGADTTQILARYFPRARPIGCRAEDAQRANRW
jgi:stage II sporulation protein D